MHHYRFYYYYTRNWTCYLFIKVTLLYVFIGHLRLKKQQSEIVICFYLTSKLKKQQSEWIRYAWQCLPSAYTFCWLLTRKCVIIALLLHESEIVICLLKSAIYNSIILFGKCMTYVCFCSLTDRFFKLINFFGKQISN